MGFPYADPFALEPGAIPTDAIPILRRTPVLVHPENRPGIPVEPGHRDYYQASLSGTAAAGGDGGTSPPPAADDGCCE